MKANKIMTGQAKTKPRAGKKAKNNTDSAAHDQTFKQQRQLNDRNYYVPINTNTEC
jgi:hypothetical protein